MSLGARRPAPPACSDDAAVAGKRAAGVATDRATDYAAVRRRRAIQRDMIARSRSPDRSARRLASIGALRWRPRTTFPSRCAKENLPAPSWCVEAPVYLRYCSATSPTYARIERAPPSVRRIIDRTPRPLATPGGREGKLDGCRGNHFCIFARAIPRLRRKCELRRANDRGN